MSIYQCCKISTTPQGKTAYHQQETMLSEKNRNNCDPKRNSYKDMCKFIRSFEKKNDKQVLPMLIGDWNEEYIGRSNSKKLCDEFGLVNIFQGKFPNHEKLKTYQEGSMFINYGLIHKELIEEIDQVTYEPVGYRKGKGDHRGWYFDIRETALFGNQIDGVYQSKGRSLQSKVVKNYRIT